MKKNRIAAICAIAFVSILAFTLYSCENSNDSIAEQSEKMTVEDFNYLGEWHNEFLINAHENFNLALAESNSESVKEVALDALKQLNKSFAASTIQRYNINVSQKEANTKFDEYYRFADSEYLADIMFDNAPTRSVSGDDVAGLQAMIEEIKDSQIISEFSYRILQDLMSSVEANYNKLLSDDELKQKVLLLIQKVNNHGYEKESTEGTLVASILAISIHSLDFWEENPDMLYTDGKVAPWVAADVGGAIVGMVFTTISSRTITGSVNSKAVAASAVFGAISASTGLPGKVGGFIDKWL